MEEKSLVYQANLQGSEAGIAAYKQINEEFSRGCEINKELLMEILRDNQDTEYGKKYDFANIKSVAEYQAKLPVITYDDIVAHIDRMAEGEKNVLTAYPFSHLNETSATTGALKRIPMTDKQAAVFVKYNKQYMDGLKALEIDPSWMEGRAFCTSEGNHHTLPSGLTVGCASSVMAKYIRGGKETMGAMMSTLFTSPIEAIVPEPGTDTKYLHARFALMDKNVSGIIAPLYSLMVNYLRYIGDNYGMLIHDIETGGIDDSIRMSKETKQGLLRKIRPMPERAAELREIFRDGSDFCFVPKVWPNMRYITGIGGDGFSIYDRIIKERYTGDTLKNIYSGVTASEGLWSIPGGIDTEDSVMAPGSAFFEFLPVECGNDFTKCVAMDKVEEGKIYELIVTNFCGFYRYRTSDAVMVTGFRGNTPLIRFMYRVNRTIDMAGEKTTEKALQLAVENTAADLGFELSDFCMYPDYDNMTYVFLVEPMTDNIKISDEELTSCIFKHMREASVLFGIAVDIGRLKEPKAHWLQPQTSRLYRDLEIMKGAPASQLKPVRIIANEEQRKFFFALRL